MNDPAFSPARQLADAVRNGELSPVALVQSCLDRIDAVNPSLNAFVALRREGALAEAGALQKEIVAGKRLGPLAGLPVGVKDLGDVAGLPTAYGSLPSKDYRAFYPGLHHGEAITPALPFNLSGHPAASVRADFTDAGLPAGLPIVGPRFRDDLVLQASYAYEQRRPWNDRWPDL